MEGADPHIGSQGNLERVDENRVEVILPRHLAPKVLQALFRSHPYEEVAYYLNDLTNKDQSIGSGMTGLLPEPLEPDEFLKYVQEKMGLSVIRHTEKNNGKIEVVAFCGGAGSFLLGDAKRAGADAFITGDFKYHEFFDAEGRLMILDIGHYESEVFTKELLAEFMKEKFTNIAPVLSGVDTNPVRYFK